MSLPDGKTTSHLIVNVLAMDHPPLGGTSTRDHSLSSTLHDVTPSHSLTVPHNSSSTVDSNGDNIHIPPFDFYQTSQHTIDNENSGSQETIAYSNGEGLNFCTTPQETRSSAIKTVMTPKEHTVWPGHKAPMFRGRETKARQRKGVCRFMAACSQRTKVFIKIWVALWVLGGTILVCMAVSKVANSGVYQASH